MPSKPDKPFVNYHVGDSQVGKSLAQGLKQFLPEDSWRAVQALIRQRRVQVNGNLCMDETRRLRDGDVIKVWEHPLPPPVDERSIKVHYADAHLVVVDKPAGITTLRHAEERHWPAERRRRQPTLDELVPLALARHLGWELPPPKPAGAPSKRKPGRGQPENRARTPQLPQIRAVHRLDRDTSGLMVFARTQQAEAALIRIFSKHRIERAYLAVVHGAPAEQTIESLLVRDRGDGLRGSLPAGAAAEEAQQAITHVRPLKRIGDYSLIECRLETGRTHQIRIHLSEQGHMLCGEKVYTHPLGAKPQLDRSGCPRQALHAAELGFVHPLTSETLRFRSPLPREFSQWLEKLGKSETS